jgi:hypothetical protein
MRSALLRAKRERERDAAGRKDTKPFEILLTPCILLPLEAFVRPETPVRTAKMQAGGRKGGKRNSSVQTNELEEYFSALGTETNEHVEDRSKVALTNDTSALAEEVRRLKAFVAHLRDQVSELPDKRENRAGKKQRFSRGIVTASGIATVLIALVALGAAARVLSQGRSA